MGLVIHLEANNSDSVRLGDPTYGRVLNTSAVDAVPAEGRVRVSYTEKPGYYYPFGPRWVLRVPHYRIDKLAFGPLTPSTIVKPRIAPPLFGVQTLESIFLDTAGGQSTDPPEHTGAKLPTARRAAGPLGWQGDVASVREQTAIALASEIGVTSPLRDHDDCTPRETECVTAQTMGQSPETSIDLIDDLVEYQSTLPIPIAPPANANPRGAHLFRMVGCQSCHDDQPTTMRGSATLIIPFTDLRLHDLGLSMDDETAGGAKIATLWRTAPLWGIARRLHNHSPATFLHDGRARSAEEAILWHGGAAAKVTRRFMQLGAQDRVALLEWLDSL